MIRDLVIVLDIVEPSFVLDRIRDLLIVLGIVEALYWIG